MLVYGPVLILFHHYSFLQYIGGDVGAWSSARQFSADGHLLRGLPGEIRRKWENRGRENIVKEILVIISV